jgi:hypothetical protein
MAQPLSIHKGHYSDSYYVLERCWGRFARSNETIPFVFRVCVKVIIDPRIDHLTDHPMGCNPNMLVHTLRALDPQSGLPSDMYQESHGARPILNAKELVMIIIIVLMLSRVA